MDKTIQIEDELIHQGEELQIKKKSIARSSTENTNSLREEVQTRNESIDHGMILPLTEQRNTLVKSETISIKTDLKTEVKEEKFREFEANEQVGVDLITGKEFETPFVKSELFHMKKEVKSDVKQEPLETFEAREQGRIDFITSRNFDLSFYESEWNKLIKPCYLKLVKIDQQYQQISKIAKKTGQKKKIDHCKKKV